MQDPGRRQDVHRLPVWVRKKKREQSWLCHGDSTKEKEFSYLGLGHSLQ